LEPSDVDEEENVLHIRVKKGWSPKDQEDRDIPLVEPMRTVLLTLKHQNPDARWLLPRGDKRTYKCQRCGGPTTHIGNLRTAILALAKAAGISKRLTHHILRHCNSTHNRQLGAKDYEVMELLGQQSTKVHAIYTPPPRSGNISWLQPNGWARRSGRMGYPPGCPRGREKRKRPMVPMVRRPATAGEEL
jgi:integrase